MGQFDSQYKPNSIGATGHWKLSATFLILSQRIKAYLLLRYCIKNLSIVYLMVLCLTYFGFLSRSSLDLKICSWKTRHSVDKMWLLIIRSLECKQLCMKYVLFTAVKRCDRRAVQESPVCRMSPRMAFWNWRMDSEGRCYQGSDNPTRKRHSFRFITHVRLISYISFRTFHCNIAACVVHQTVNSI